MTRWSLFLQTLSLLHHFLGLYYWRARAARAHALFGDELPRILEELNMELVA